MVVHARVLLAPAGCRGGGTVREEPQRHRRGNVAVDPRPDRREPPDDADRDSSTSSCTPSTRPAFPTTV